MLHLDDNKNVPLYEQLFWEIRNNILKGEFEKNQRLTPIRILANELEISHNTVSKAYQQLVAEGYVRAVTGSGYYVEELQTLKEINRQKNSSVNKNTIYSEQDIPIKYNFCYEGFSSEIFPWNKWRRYLLEALTEESYANHISYEVNKGNLELRKSLCKYLHKNRGVKCDPQQIVISTGTQYAMNILADIFPKRTYKIGVEEPGYDGMRQVFLNKGYKICPINMTKDGINANILEQTDCDLLYLTPSHQFPTGITLSMSKRLQILEWGRRNKCYIIENDYDNEFLYGERPILSMQSMDRGERVIYMGTLSKVLTPELRCAFTVLPPHLMKIYEEKFSHFYSPISVYEQKALAAFIDNGGLERQSRSMAVLNRRKCEVIYKILNSELKKEVKCFPTPAGSHLLVKIFGFKNQKDLIYEMRQYGIQIYETDDYWFASEHEDKDVYLIGFSGILEENLREACMEFVDALRKIIKKKINNVRKDKIC